MGCLTAGRLEGAREGSHGRVQGLPAPGRTAASLKARSVTEILRTAVGSHQAG
jgi:hypothetical protein